MNQTGTFTVFILVRVRPHYEIERVVVREHNVTREQARVKAEQHHASVRDMGKDVARLYNYVWQAQPEPLLL